MRKIMLITVLLCGWAGVASAEPLADARARIEADYKNDLAVCVELDKAEQAGCKKDAAATRKSAYNSAWEDRSPATPKTYPQPYSQAKTQIDRDYRSQQAFCQQLDKANASACQRDALNQQKAALKLALANKNAPAAPACTTCGVITKVEEVEKPGEGSLVGKIGGAVVGGVLGNQVGKGTGRTVATVIGAIGGGFAGNEVEKRVSKKKYYEVSFQLNSGETNTIAFDTAEHGYRVGDKVRFENNQLAHR
ncbi:hypothetical protein IGB42_02686 [Andreprevotia sp. IGB-42]|nr:glycine zipper 2TM domain-containing protein [Andreprevotia sp. IGB-42]KAF0812843.1 hypothetical protein IGB42_02686 [Andreprevotia sp. IGB-42]